MNTLESFPQTNTTTRAKTITRDLELSKETVPSSELRVFRILQELERQGALNEQVARIKEKFKEPLESLGNDFDESCWKLLTVLELFDEDTATHCINTYLIAKNKIEKELWNGMVLADEFKKESVSLSQFYRACLFHDIGKVEVPHSVLVNRTTDEHCAELLFQHKDDVLIPALKNKFGAQYVLPEHIRDEHDLLKYLYDELHMRPQTIAPVKLLLDAPIEDEVASQLEHCGCSAEDSLLTIMQTHDGYSKKILQGLGFTVEGELAGSHHKHKEQSIRYKITVGTLQVTIDLADIVHLADVENAILSKRYYKKEKTALDALKILSLHAKQGFIDDYVAYIWIADEMNKLAREGVPKEHEEGFATVARFLDEEKAKHPAWPNWGIDYMSLKAAA